jgi:hypothetical protein
MMVFGEKRVYTRFYSADRFGLHIIGATGIGYIHHSLAEFLPEKLFENVERVLAGRPRPWRFEANLLAVSKRK